MVARPGLEEELKAFDDYLRYGTDEERSKAETSRHAYCWTVERLHRFLDGRAATPELGREFIMGLEKEGNSPSSINRHIWALKSYYRFKGEEKFKLRGLPTQEHKPRFLDDGEWEKLLGMAGAPLYNPSMPEYARKRARLELALLLAYCGGGLRCSEAVRMERTDILEEGFLRVERKGGREDFVPVEDEVLRAFKEYLADHPNGRYVFPGKEADSHMAERTAQGIIKNLCRRAGLGDVHVHSLRHTAGYQLRKGGASERDIQDFLGHKNIQTTKIYTHLLGDDLRARLPKRFQHARQGRMV